MNLLKQGKTNWKYILIVAILAILVGGGILWWVAKQEVPPAELPEIKKPEKVVEEETAEEFFRVIQPEANQKITSPIQIKGKANLSENELVKEWVDKGYVDDDLISIVIYDGSDYKLGFGRIPTKNGGLKGPFTIDVSYSLPHSQKGLIKITRYSPTEGFVPTKGVYASISPKVLVEIPVIFTEDVTLAKCPNIIFEDYPVAEIYKGEIAEVDFESYPAAYEFRTRITEGAKEGPNFAGQYTVVTWGCGSSCGISAIVNSKTGKIVHFGLYSFADIIYKLDSRLLIVYSGPPSSEEGEPMIDYYELKDEKLELICKNH